MKYKRFGKTGCNVSAIGFGGMRFDEKESNETNAALVRYAFDSGITYFDTAPGYNADRSEDIFGIAFEQMRRDRYFVATKLMPGHVADADETFRKIQKSVARLHTGYIDFFHVWCIRTQEQIEQAMKPNGLYEGIVRAKDAGLVRHIGFSTHLKGDGVRSIIESGKFESVLLGVNVLNFPYRRDGLLAAKEHDLGVAAMNPLAGGLIPKHADRFGFLCEQGETPVEAALRFVIANPYISVALNGFTTREHIDQACRVADRAEPLSDAHLAAIRRRLSERMSAMCTSCAYCRKCPAGIDVPSYMQFYNNKAVFGTPDQEMASSIHGQQEWGILAQSKARPAACTRCGACARVCTQHLDIPACMSEMAAWDAEADKKE